ncbi:Ig-like domain-containing protein [Bradyrhizobium sp. sGM-13]|uniref:Ig-like domain-containing protein n=1 Tax=Bradyrhizobium sp. sGM-13 TaxID=2831781 RepID=UPI001BD071AC|nr:Ig-like domain-containing protein [Bradyrhizobium sp. sGM-13]
MATIPLSWNDPLFSDNTNSGFVNMVNPGTLSNTSITKAGGASVAVGVRYTGSGSFTLNDVRMQGTEGVDIFSGGDVYINNSYIDTTGAAGDHADGIQVYAPGTKGNLTVTNTTIVSHNQNATAGVFVADDRLGGDYTFNNVVFDGGPFGLRINADAGAGYTYNVALKDVYFIQGSFGSAPFLIYVPPGYEGATLNITQWDNVRWATIVDGQLVPGNLIPPPQPVTGGGTGTPPSSPSTPPGAPSISSWSPDSGKTGDGITNANKIDVKGTAAANATITVYDNGNQIGTTKADANGSWDYITGVLNNAKHVLTATATNSSGQTSAKSGAVTVTVDTLAPTAPTLSSNAIVNTNQVKLSGTAEANSTVTVYDGTTVVGTGTTNSTGAWSVTTNALSTGTHALTAKAADAAGNVSAASQSVSSVIGGTSPTPTPGELVESAGSTSLVENGGKYYLNSSSGSGPTLKYRGADFVDGQDGTWTPIGAEKTATGYQVAWKEASTGQYTAWNTDNNGNYVSHVSALTGSVSGGQVSGTNSALKSLETSFQQDLNGDGTTGVVTNAIESAGSTSLIQIGENYKFSSGGDSGPTLRMNGTAVVEGQFGGWAPIGAEQTATGYQVAWKFADKDQYVVWNTDNSGNHVSDVTGMSGSALQSFEASFQQDLNGDGTTGTVTNTIESVGLTSLIQIGENYRFSSGGGSSSTLKMNGTAVVEGQFGGWAPIGAEQTATGYQIAWKFADKDQYVVWNTDSSGNHVSDVTGMSASALQSFEASFQQDLNGDGTTGIVTNTIESVGLTSLIQIGENYIFSSGGGSGPTLKMNGTAVVEGQFGGWAPIGAEQTATGYQIAWKFADKDQYVVWNTDSSGNHVSDVTGMSASALKSFETSFKQDLNGDGVIGSSSASLSVGLTTMYKNWNDIVTIKGFADANSQVKLYDGNTSIGKVTAAADGTWSFQTSSAVSDTLHTYTAKQIDSAGHVVGTSGSAILGSTGSNTLKSTSGNDILVGGGQSDTFAFAANFGRDIIKDFAASGSAQDTIQFSKTVFDSFASVLSHASQVGQDIVISSGSDTLTLKNTKLSALSSQDFHFA